VGEDQTAGGLEWGYALPGAPTGSNDEYIGYLVSTISNCE
jgi:cellobiose dehydrogenase (acceptor)